MCAGRGAHGSARLRAGGGVMRSAEPSRTAMMSATCRGAHRLHDAAPWVFDDPFALSLVGPAWPEILGAMATRFSEPMLRQATASMVNRSRYAEDRLLAGAFAQYVILGAGLDSFAWRRPDVLRALRVYEVDHPATQAWKRERAEALALPTSDEHVFAPVDFESETLRHGLDAAGFDWSRPTLFSWLGVTQYLTTDAIRATLRTVAGSAPGSEIVFTYVPPPPFLDELGLEFIEVVSNVAGERGEPFRTFLSPADARTLVEEHGDLEIREDLSRDDLHGRYFSDRSDGLTPYTAQRFVAAAVTGPPGA